MCQNILKVITEGWKVFRVTICEDVLERLEDDPDHLTRIITGEESCVYQYDSNKATSGRHCSHRVQVNNKGNADHFQQGHRAPRYCA